MQYRLLGRSGLRVSELCLGTMTFGEDWAGARMKKRVVTFSSCLCKRAEISAGVQNIADELGRSPAQVALNWVRQRDNMIPIIGARTGEQLRDNLACLEFTLSPPEMQVLDEASKIEMGYPHDYLREQRVHEFLHGGTFEQISNHRAKTEMETQAKPEKVA